MKEMKKVILITGVAGFIGSNLAKNILQKDSEVQVIGVDNLNDYYDVSLKEYRLKELENWDHFSFHKGNIADRSFLEQIFQKWEPEIVVNLAAQAGVRSRTRMLISRAISLDFIIFWNAAGILMMTESQV